MTPSQSYCEIPLGNGLFTKVDEDVFALVGGLKWHVNRCRSGNLYAVRHTTNKFIFLHRFVLGLCADDPRRCDHVNGDGLDNRRENLRASTIRQNNWNARLRYDNTSGFKGVYKHRSKFSARIGFMGEMIHLGTFDTAELAAEAYREKAKILFGEFANPAARKDAK